MSIHLLMQAYHLPAILEEARLAILSIAAQHEGRLPAPLLLFTDKPDYFRPSLSGLELHYRNIDLEQIIAWQGPYKFVHRMKIEIIRRAYAELHSDLLYLDTDVFCEQDIRPMLAQIQQNQAFMHVCESNLWAPKTKFMHKISKFIKSNPGLIPAQTAEKPYFMWNAGLIGLPSLHAPEILEQVLVMNDELYPHLKSHTTEQLCFSVILGNRYNLLPADDYFYHYWHMKEFRHLAHRFFEYSDQNQLDLQSQIALLPQICPKKLSGPKTRFDALPKPIRILREKLGYNWEFEVPEFLKK